MGRQELGQSECVCNCTGDEVGGGNERRSGTCAVTPSSAPCCVCDVWAGEWILKMAGAAPVYCVCRQPYDVSRFMIECDICKDWFHSR